MSLLPTLLLALLPALLGAQQDSDALTRIEAGLLEARAADEPGLALEHLSPKPAEIIASMMDSDRNREWARRITALEIELTHINRHRLDPMTSARADAMEAALLTERILIDTHSSDRWHAQGFARRMEECLGHLAHAAPSSKNYLAISSILEQLPFYWEVVGRSLIAPLQKWNAMGADQVARLHELIVELQAHDLTDLWEQDRLLRWQAILKRAEKSSREFEAQLRTQPERSGIRPTRLEAEHWLRLVHAASGNDLELAKTKWRALAFIADMEQAFGKHWRTSAPPASAKDPVRHMLSVTSAGNQFLTRAELLGSSSMPSITAKFNLRRSSPRPLQPIRSLRSPGVLELLLDTQLESSSRAFLSALALRAALPQVWFPGRQALRQSRAMSAGWSLYALDWALRIDWIQNNLRAVPGLPATVAHLKVIEAARFLAALEVHAEGYRHVEASERFMQRTGLSRERAQREVDSATLDPLHGIGYLAWVEWLALEKHLGGGKEGLLTCLRLSAERPELRPRDIRSSLGGKLASKR